jgi:hypothetical protein
MEVSREVAKAMGVIQKARKIMFLQEFVMKRGADHPLKNLKISL